MRVAEGPGYRQTENAAVLARTASETGRGDVLLSLPLGADAARGAFAVEADPREPAREHHGSRKAHQSANVAQSTLFVYMVFLKFDD